MVKGCKQISGLAESNMTLRRSLDHQPFSAPAISLSSVSYNTQISCSAFTPASIAKKVKPLHKPRRCHQTKNSGKPYKHIPHRLKPAHLVAKRNARERKRVQAVNSAFFKLRKHVPHEARHRRLSKVKTLRYAIEYIQHLQKLIEKHDRLQSGERQTSDMSPNYSHYHYHNFLLSQGSPDLFTETNGCLAEMSLRESNTDASCPKVTLSNSARTSLSRCANTISSDFSNWCVQFSPNRLSVVERVTGNSPIAHRDPQSLNVHSRDTGDSIMSHETRLCCTLSVYQFDTVSGHVNQESGGLDQVTYEIPFSRHLPFCGPFLFSENSASEMPCEAVCHKPVLSETVCSNQNSRNLPSSQHQTYVAPSGPVSNCCIVTEGYAVPESTGYPSPMGSFPVYVSRCGSASDGGCTTRISGHMRGNDQDCSLLFARTDPVLSPKENYSVYHRPQQNISGGHAY